MAIRRCEWRPMTTINSVASLSPGPLSWRGGKHPRRSGNAPARAGREPRGPTLRRSSIHLYHNQARPHSDNKQVTQDTAQAHRPSASPHMTHQKFRMFCCHSPLDFSPCPFHAGRAPPHSPHPSPISSPATSVPSSSPAPRGNSALLRRRQSHSFSFRSPACSPAAQRKNLGMRPSRTSEMSVPSK